MSVRLPAARVLLLGLVVLGPSACVKKSTHRVVLDDLDQARGRIVGLEADVDSLAAERADLLARMEAEQQRRDSIESSLHTEIARLETLNTRENAEHQREVARLQSLLLDQGADVDALQSRLATLESVEREVRERNAIYESVIARFQSLMDGGQLSVAIQRGRLVILLPQDILFASGSATLGTEGQTVIAQVAEVLAEFSDRSFQVEGHTDDVPISTARFPSNWELSSARALAVVRLLIGNGVDPANISGAAFGEHQPVADNDSAENRRRNRRIEIVMLPNLDVIAETQLPGR